MLNLGIPRLKKTDTFFDTLGGESSPMELVEIEKVKSY